MPQAPALPLRPMGVTRRGLAAAASEAGLLPLIMPALVCILSVEPTIAVRQSVEADPFLEPPGIHSTGEAP